jgi:hypothetical protein
MQPGDGPQVQQQLRGVDLPSRAPHSLSAAPRRKAPKAHQSHQCDPRESIGTGNITCRREGNLDQARNERWGPQLSNRGHYAPSSILFPSTAEVDKGQLINAQRSRPTRQPATSAAPTSRMQRAVCMLRVGAGGTRPRDKTPGNRELRGVGI